MNWIIEGGPLAGKFTDGDGKLDPTLRGMRFAPGDTITIHWAGNDCYAKYYCTETTKFPPSQVLVSNALVARACGMSAYNQLKSGAFPPSVVAHVIRKLSKC